MHDMNLNDHLCFSVYALSHAFNRLYKDLLKDIGLTYPQYLVMLVLWEEDQQTVGEIGKRLSLQSNTLTPIMKRLEGMGFLTRMRRRDDERQVAVHLTESGRTLKNLAKEIPACVLAASELSQEEVDQMIEGLDRLRMSLKANSV